MKSLHNMEDKTGTAISGEKMGNTTVVAETAPFASLIIDLP